LNRHICIKYFRLTLLFVLTFFYVDLFPQSGILKFEHFSTDDGLSNKHVHCIMQDSYGFLWIGTDDGLNRFDGYEFVIYNHDPMDPNSLSSPRIRLLTEDGQGNIWIAASELNLYKRMTGSFVHYTHNSENKYSISDNDVTSIIIDRNNPNYIWFGTGSGGLNLFDTGVQKFYAIKHDPGNSGSLSGDAIESLYLDSFGNLWIGTARSGLNRIQLDSIPRKADGKYDVEKLNSIESEHYLNNRNSDSLNSAAKIINVYEDKNKI
jgi:ligand-binding sensor domain-containing protein